MAKKYMLCENMDLIKKFEIPFIRATISYRCNRILCSCGAIVDGVTHICADTKDKKPLYCNISSGNTILVYNHKNLFLEEVVSDEGEILYKMYYPTLVIVVHQEEGKLTLKEEKALVATFNEKSISIYSPKDGDKIPIQKIENLISTVLPSECENIYSYFRIAETLQLQNVSNLYKYIRIIGNKKCSLFKDAEFVKNHKDVVNDLLSSNYGATNITDEDKLCEYYKIPQCLYKFTADEYFDKTLKNHNYKDIVSFGNYPQRIIGWISYYMEIGKFTKASIADFIRVFTPSFFDSDLKIDCFVKFIVKNQYLGDKTFSVAKKVFQYLENNNIEINESTVNAKYYFNTTNYKELCKELGNAKADEFEYLRETSGIIVSMKRLLED